MLYRAISTGYAIPLTNFNATIHSIFRTAVNLKPANNDLLFTLVGARAADLPQSIRLNAPDDLCFVQLNTGDKVFCRASTLIFENSTLEVGFSQSKRWLCNLSTLRADLSKRVVSEAWKYVWKLLNEQQKRMGAEIVAEALLHPETFTQSSVCSRMGKAIHTLIEAGRSYQVDILSALTRIIGLGCGLTPSGDDFLVGYLAGLWCAVRDFVERRRFVSQLGQAVIHLSKRTNEISRTYLHHAAYGQVSSHLNNLAEVISKPESSGYILAATESAMHSGHTSGMDAVTGLLFGLSTWDGEEVLAPTTSPR
jgi:hypothetical protein